MLRSKNLNCSFCQKLFPRTGLAHKFCTPHCRYLASRTRPGRIEKDRASSSKYQKDHRKERNAYSKRHRRGYILKRLGSEPWITLLYAARQRATKQQLKFELDAEWAKKRWTGYCELTNLPFHDPSKRVGYKNRNFTPSIDRIDPRIGYTQANCQFILWAINSFKRDSSMAEMYRIATALLNHRLNTTAP